MCFAGYGIKISADYLYGKTAEDAETEAWSRLQQHVEACGVGWEPEEWTMLHGAKIVHGS